VENRCRKFLLDNSRGGSVARTFTHHGQMHLKDSSDRTIAIRRAAARLGGRYDGGETAIVPAR
jgi:hypothetical protein